MNSNNYENQKLRGLKRKYEAVLSRGGKCENCGYNNNISALEFHHINPDEKEFQLDVRHFSNTKLETLEQELQKCKLLCANCHREEHNKGLLFTNIPTLLEGCDKESFSNPSGNVCPVCNKRFPKSAGKTYCSKECREADKHYPSIEELEEQYKILKTWEKVAEHFNISRRVTQTIRKKAVI